jgi:hypothetical protein
MEEENTNLLTGLIYKEFDIRSQGTHYFIIQEAKRTKGETTYNEAITTLFGDQIISQRAISSRQIKLQEKIKSPGGRYPSQNHTPSKKKVLLNEEEFQRFLEYHPKTLEQLREQTDIKEFLRTPGYD